MKRYIEDLWFDELEDGTINIGFTRSFIERKMMECFHVIQADTKYIDKDGPLLVIETNEALESIKSPIGGRVVYFNSKARNFPDRLTEEDIIFSLTTKPVVEKVAKKPKEVNIFNEVQFINNWDIRDIPPDVRIGGL